MLHKFGLIPASSARFLSVKGPELLSKYIGESEAGVRKARMGYMEGMRTLQHPLFTGIRTGCSSSSGRDFL